MVEVNTLIAGATSGAAQSANVTFFFMLLFLLLAVVFGIIAFFVYKAKFNIDLIIIPFNGQPTLTGVKARDYFVKGKDYRFKIWAAKRLKLKYNEESIEPSQISIHKKANGKVRRLIFMSMDSSGMLVPITVMPETLAYTLRKIGDDGKETEELVKTTVARAKYGDVDEAWGSVEKDKWTSLFRPNDKQFMWGFVILCCLVVLALGAFLWGINKNAEVAESNLAVASQQARSNALMVESLCVITEKCVNSTNPSTGQPFNSIIVT